jgi:hypothetical protein
MKLSKMFLAGILALALVFGLALAGCGDGGGGGEETPANELSAGSWVDSRASPTTAFIFTNQAEGVQAGAKIAYWSTNLSEEQRSASSSEIMIRGTSYPYTYESNKLLLPGYVNFNRAKGTSGSSISGIWISSDVSSDSPRYTLLIIRTGTGTTYTSVGADNGGESAYTLTKDANTTYIKWSDLVPLPYSKTADPTQLALTAPNGIRISDLMTLDAW